MDLNMVQLPLNQCFKLLNISKHNRVSVISCIYTHLNITGHGSYKYSSQLTYSSMYVLCTTNTFVFQSMIWSHARIPASRPTVPGRACSTEWATPSSSPVSRVTDWRVRRG